MGETRHSVLGISPIRFYLHRLSVMIVIFVMVVTVTNHASIQTAHAQGSSSENRENITLTPASSQYTSRAGGVVNDRLTVVNDGKSADDFIVYARPYSVDSDKYSNPNFTAVTKYSDLYAWVQIPQTKYRAEPNTTTHVNYSINVPSGASPGGHYGVIFVEVQPIKSVDNANEILRKKRVGSLVYLTVDGDIKLSGEVAPGGGIPFWQVQPPLRATASVKNTGNTHFTMSTVLHVKDVLGNVKYQGKKEFYILPGTTRKVDLDWVQASWFGLYKVALDQKFLGKAYSHEGYVLIMPRYLPAVLMIIIVIGGVYAAARRKKK